MRELWSWLAGGDLRSDGMASEVADTVLKNPHLINELMEGLRVPDKVVRGRTAHALERISRFQPDTLVNHLPKLLQVAQEDPVSMVRWHIAMILGNLTIYEEWVDRITERLLDLLQDDSVFVKSWAIVSLCVLGRKYVEKREQITQEIMPLLRDSSTALKTRAEKGVRVLMNDETPFPKGWIKSEHLKGL
ncbi:MAG: HEAT repeat domain-containing protein [Chloroflexota bacterium]